jgi:hypothetical protein
MELNGALSNPFETDKSLLIRRNQLQRRLPEKALARPRQPRPAPISSSPVLEAVTLVLELAARPMRASEIYGAADERLGRPLRWSSVKGVLSAYPLGGDHRFRRLSRGVYELAN